MGCIVSQNTNIVEEKVFTVEMLDIRENMIFFPENLQLIIQENQNKLIYSIARVIIQMYHKENRNTLMLEFPEEYSLKEHYLLVQIFLNLVNHYLRQLSFKNCIVQIQKVNQINNSKVALNVNQLNATQYLISNFANHEQIEQIINKISKYFVQNKQHIKEQPYFNLYYNKSFLQNQLTQDQKTHKVCRQLKNNTMLVDEQKYNQFIMLLQNVILQIFNKNSIILLHYNSQMCISVFTYKQDIQAECASLQEYLFKCNDNLNSQYVQILKQIEQIRVQAQQDMVMDKSKSNKKQPIKKLITRSYSRKLQLMNLKLLQNVKLPTILINIFNFINWYANMQCMLCLKYDGIESQDNDNFENIYVNLHPAEDFPIYMDTLRKQVIEQCKDEIILKKLGLQSDQQQQLKIQDQNFMINIYSELLTNLFQNSQSDTISFTQLLENNIDIRFLIQNTEKINTKQVTYQIDKILNNCLYFKIIKQPNLGEKLYSGGLQNTSENTVAVQLYQKENQHTSSSFSRKSTNACTTE